MKINLTIKFYGLALRLLKMLVWRQLHPLNEVMQWVISSYRFLKIYFNIYQNSTIDKKEHWIELVIK